VLAAAGFSDLADQRAGFDGASGPGGFEPGWRAKGLPVSTRASAERAYHALKGKVR
jgi:parvulin-like peptidyl-prolyl isomerase